MLLLLSLALGASQAGGAQGLPPGFKLPKIDFNKLNNPKKDGNQ